MSTLELGTMAYHHGDLAPALIDAAIVHLDAEAEIPSLRALADACGVSHGAPYRHFRDAAELRAKIAARCFDELTATIRAAEAGVDEPRARLAAGCRAYLDWGVAHPARYTLMFGVSSPVTADDTCQASATAAFATLIEAVAGVGAKDPARTASAAWAALHGTVDLARQGLSSPAGTRAEDVADDVIGMIVAWAGG